MTQRCEICEAEIEYGWPVSCLHCSTQLAPLEKAALDLLEACESLLRQLKYCESLLDPVEYDATQVSPAEEKGRAAIAKAKGKANAERT